MNPCSPVKRGIDATDEIFKLKNLQNNLLDKLVLRGIKNIPKINMRKLKNQLKFENGNYTTRDIWVLDTIGTNLNEILSQDSIDYTRTFTNDIRETYEVLGIEAARQSIYNELIDVISFDGTYINHHHLELLCDRMAASLNLVSIFRHGVEQ